MAALVLRDGADVRPGGVRRLARRATTHRAEVAAALRAGRCATRRRTGTNKIVKRTLVHQKFRPDRVGGDALFVRSRASRPLPTVRRPTTRRRCTRAFVAAGRERFWDL